MKNLSFPQNIFDKEKLELKEKLTHHFNRVINSSKTPLDKNHLAKWAYKSFFTYFPYPPIKRNDSDFINNMQDIIANELGYNLQVKASLQKTSLNDIEKRKWQVYVEIYIPHFVKDQMEATPELGNKQELARDAYKFMLDYIPPEVQADPDFEVIVNKVRDDLQEEYGDFLSEDFVIPDAPRTEEAIEPTNDPTDDNEGAQLVNEDGQVVNERFDEPNSLNFNDIYQNNDSASDVKEEMINEYLDELHQAINSGDSRKVDQIKRKLEELQSLSSLKLDWLRIRKEQYNVYAEDPSLVYLDKKTLWNTIVADSPEEAIEIAKKQNIEENDGDTSEADTLVWTTSIWTGERRRSSSLNLDWQVDKHTSKSIAKSLEVPPGWEIRHFNGVQNNTIGIYPVQENLSRVIKPSNQQTVFTGIQNQLDEKNIEHVLKMDEKYPWAIRIYVPNARKMLDIDTWRGVIKALESRGYSRDIMKSSESDFIKTRNGNRTLEVYTPPTHAKTKEIAGVIEGLTGMSTIIRKAPNRYGRNIQNSIIIVKALNDSLSLNWAVSTEIEEGDEVRVIADPSWVNKMYSVIIADPETVTFMEEENVTYSEIKIKIMNFYRSVKGEVFEIFHVEPNKDSGIEGDMVYTLFLPNLWESIVANYSLHTFFDASELELVNKKQSSLKLDWAEVPDPSIDYNVEWFKIKMKVIDDAGIDNGVLSWNVPLREGVNQETDARFKDKFKMDIDTALTSHNASLKFSVFNNIEGEQNETNINENAQKAQNTEDTQNQVNQHDTQEAPQSPQEAQLNIYYLDADDIVEAHERIIKQYGGAKGIFEGGYEKLEAAIGRMQSAFGDQEFYPSIFEKTAVLMHSIITTHPFMDGNKRTAYASALMFLHDNGFTIDDSEELAGIIIQVASDEANYNHLLENISKNAKHWLDSHAKSFKKLTSLKLDWAKLPDNETKPNRLDPNIVLRKIQKQLEDEIASGQPGMNPDQHYNYVHPIPENYLVASSLQFIAIIEKHKCDWYYMAERAYMGDVLFDLVGVWGNHTVEVIEPAVVESLSEIMSLQQLSSLKLDWAQNLNRYELTLNFIIDAKKLVGVHSTPDKAKEKKYADRFLGKIQDAMARANQGSILLVEKMRYTWDAPDSSRADAFFTWQIQGTESELRKFLEILQSTEKYFLPYREENELEDEFTEENVLTSSNTASLKLAWNIPSPDLDRMRTFMVNYNVTGMLEDPTWREEGLTRAEAIQIVQDDIDSWTEEYLIKEYNEAMQDEN